MTDQRLLILDDNLLTGRAIAGIAEFMGINVRLTTDFDGFIHEISNWQPSHLMIDLIRPDKDGVEVLIELARRGIDSQLILTSGAGTSAVFSGYLHRSAITQAGHSGLRALQT